MDVVLNLSLEAWSLGLRLETQSLGLEAWSLGLGYPSTYYITAVKWLCVRVCNHYRVCKRTSGAHAMPN